jgi:hypothetical protein
LRAYIGFSTRGKHAEKLRLNAVEATLRKFIAEFDAAARPMAQREFEVLLAEERKNQT